MKSFLNSCRGFIGCISFFNSTVSLLCFCQLISDLFATSSLCNFVFITFMGLYNGDLAIDFFFDFSILFFHLIH